MGVVSNISGKLGQSISIIQINKIIFRTRNGFEIDFPKY